MQNNFGLIFKNTFNQMEMSGTNVASIVSTNLSCALFSGTCAAPFIKRFGVRTVAVVGAIIFTTGIVSLTYSTSYISFMMSYGMLTGVGEGLLRLTTALAINLYFLKKRRKVVGFALALRSMCCSAFPPLVVVLLASYGVASSILIVGALCFHSVFASLLLRPVEWYMKKDSPVPASTSSPTEEVEIQLLDVNEENGTEIKRPRGLSQHIIYYYDMRLFKNPKFLSITTGLTFSTFADLSFETLFPFILADLHLDNQQIATFLSISFVSNVIIKCLVPYIGDYFKQSSKFMYGFCCVLVIAGRFLVIFFGSTGNASVPILWGIAHGARTVYWVVLMAENIPAQQLPSAESILQMTNGIICLLGGPLIGLIRDTTGTYISCVYALNLLTGFTCVLWSIEWIYSIFRRTTSNLQNTNECS